MYRLFISLLVGFNFNFVKEVLIGFYIGLGLDETFGFNFLKVLQSVARVGLLDGRTNILDTIDEIFDHLRHKGNFFAKQPRRFFI